MPVAQVFHNLKTVGLPDMQSTEPEIHDPIGSRPLRPYGHARPLHFRDQIKEKEYSHDVV